MSDVRLLLDRVSIELKCSIPGHLIAPCSLVHMLPWTVDAPQLQLGSRNHNIVLEFKALEI